MRTVVWIVGEPGIGKTTLARAILGPLDALALVPKPKWTLARDGRLVAAGHYSGETFDGADMVPYNGAVEAIAYWARHLAPKAEVTLLDGDRFSHAGAKAAFGAVPGGARLVCLHILGPAALAAERRAARGSDQNASWLKGRVTKAQRFADSFPTEARWHASAHDTPEGALANGLRAFLGLP